MNWYEGSEDVELQVTWRRLLRFLWAFFWRQVLIYLGFILVAMIPAIIIIVIMALRSGDRRSVEMGAAIAGYIISTLSWIASIFISYKIVIGKRIGDFRVVMVKAIREEEGHD